MKIKKTLAIILPTMALALGGSILAHSSSKASLVEAADYSSSAKDFVLNVSDNNSVSATFTVSNSKLDMRGWLLCLLSSKPDYNPDTRKLLNSDNTHPYHENAHYFYVEDTTKTGKVSVTWAGNSDDQLQNWSEHGSYDGDHTLSDYMSDKHDYYIVVGPRHYQPDWQSKDYHGAGADGGIWENCDYYVGRKSNLLNGYPEGQTYIDLSELSAWGENAKVAVHYYDNNGHDDWSGWAIETSESNIYTAQYCLDFVPTNMQVMRFNPSIVTPYIPDPWDDQVIYDTGSVSSFYEYSVIGVYGWKSSSWAGALSTIDIAGKKSVILDHYKRNGSSHSEHFNQFVFLQEGDEFTVGFNGDSYYSLNSESKVGDAIKVVDNKFHVYTSAAYAFYFDTDESARSLYITSPTLAEADDWALNFLGEGCSDTKNNWGSSRSKYLDELSDAAKEILINEDHVAHDASVSGYVAQAMQRYDYLVEFFEGYDDYMNRSNKYSFNAFQAINSISSFEEDNAMIVFVAIAASSALALTTLLVLKKKRLGR